LENNDPKFAIGAMSGSAIVVCTIALGTCIWIGANARKSKTILLLPEVRKQCWLLGGSLIVTLSLVKFGFNIYTGFGGIIYYCAFLFYSLTAKKPENSLEIHEHREEDNDIEIVNTGQPEEHEEKEIPIVKGWGFLVIGGFLIFFFSKPFIQSVEYMAEILQVTPILMAFFLAPVASEAPEILESISLSRKGSTQNINIAYSNLVGGTITKTTLLMGILCFYGVSKEYAWEIPAYPLSIILLVLCAGTAAAIGIYSSKHQANIAIVLFVLFFFTGILQYYTNVQRAPLSTPTIPV